NGLLAAAWDNGVVRFFEIGAEVKEVGKVGAHSQPITSLAFTPDGKHLATGSLDKTAKLWTIAQKAGEVTATPVALNDSKHAGEVSCVNFSPNGRFLASTTLGEPNQVKVWVLTSTLPPPLNMAPFLYAGPLIAIPSGHHNGVNCIAFHRDSME